MKFGSVYFYGSAIYPIILIVQLLCVAVNIYYALQGNMVSFIALAFCVIVFVATLEISRGGWGFVRRRNGRST